MARFLVRAMLWWLSGSVLPIAGGRPQEYETDAILSIRSSQQGSTSCRTSMLACYRTRPRTQDVYNLHSVSPVQHMIYDDDDEIVYFTAR